MKKATKLLLLNTSDKEYVKQKYHRLDNDIFIFKNGITQYHLDTQIKKKDEFIVLFNGSWIKRKGIDTLVSAAKKLLLKNMDIRYLLIGTGKDENEVKNDFPETLKNKLTIIAKFSSEQEINYLNQASIVVLPSLFEGQPLSLLQAMSAKKCCITTNADGQKDLIVDKVNGFLIPVNDSNSLTDTIEYCYNNPDMVTLMGNQAYNSVKNRTWEIVANEVVDYIVFITNNINF